MTSINPPIADVVTSSIALETEAFPLRASGETHDFWAFWEQCRDDVLSRHCLRWMNGNQTDAEDALSEASVRACEAWSNKPPELVNITGWFVRLVQNHCRNVNKAHTRRTCVVQAVEDIATEASEQVAEAGGSGPEEVVLRGEMGQHIRGAIEDLPPRLKEPAKLYFLQDVAYSDIAACLNLSPANVRKRIQQAREQLRSRLSAYLDGRGPEVRPFCMPPSAQFVGN